MLRTRVIPVLLLKGRGLVKTVRFKEPKYLGDPINTVKIFNDKYVDEIVILDIQATLEKRKPQFDLIAQIASEAFMPMCYGGGVRSLEDVKTILGIGVEKVAINSVAAEDETFVTKASDMVGSQSIVVSMDIKKNFLGKYEVYTQGGRCNVKADPVEFAVRMEKAGAGELLVNSIDCDGMMQGYDIELLKKITHAVSIPVIACGGAGNTTDLAKAVYQGGASAAAAGSMFVFQGKYRAVLITFPTEEELAPLFSH
jgi:cyclase